MDVLNQYAKSYGLHLTEAMLAQFELYSRLILEWNEKMNLTAITEKEEIIVKHFLDSLLALSVCDIPHGASLVDVGTGAGFPAIPLKIARPDLQITLLDSLQKRIGFLREISDALEQDNVVAHGRAEEIARKEQFREQFHLATARAVAALSVLCEYCIPLLQIGGIFLALKGYDVEKETEQSAGAIQALGGQLMHIYKLELPHGNKRSIIVIKKISHTSSKYPRSIRKIIKTPL